MALMFTACSSHPKGTYASSDGISTITFGDDDAITLNALGLIDIDGTYVIEDGQITVTYILPLLGTKTEWVKSYAKDGDTITIDGTDFIKQAE